MKSHPFRSLVAASLAVFLASCGGGGDTSTTSSTRSTPSSNQTASVPTDNSSPAPQPIATTANTPAVADTPVNTSNPVPQQAVVNPTTDQVPPAVVAPPAVATTTAKPAETAPAQTTQPTIPPVIAQTPAPVTTPPSTQTSPGQQASLFLRAITAPTPPASRHTQDMPDEYNDYQIHVVYAVAKGEADRGRDVTNYFTNTITAWNNWLKVESGGRKIKFDVYQEALDITYVAMPRTDQEYSTFGDGKINVITADIEQALGGFKSNKKYMVYFEGGRQYASNYVACGDTKLNNPVIVQYLLGNPAGAVCFGGRDFVASADLEPRYLDYIMIHELIHSEGAVSDGAPNAEKNHVNEDERDVMAIRGNFDGWKILDVNKSNYYNLNGLPAGVVNFAQSKFLTPPGSIN